jgi:2',3'-cyclic-nucleotide 2'-phosphodiesterase (5'-nucleotidase family)
MTSDSSRLQRFFLLRVLFLSVLLLGPTACGSDGSSPSGPGDQDPPPAEDIAFTVVYTNDEHGWIEETAETQGAAKLLGLWKSREGYTTSGSVLVVSGGDNWTGPAISTWFHGESTVDVMNAMGYSASVIGNHEFDFTVPVLEERVAQANFPFLAANLETKTTGTIPDFAEPFVIREVNGIKVGIVGLSSITTPSSAFPDYVEPYDFTGYAEALNEWVPQVWNAGADVVMVAGHICQNEMEDLALLAGSLGVSILGGGHCHQRVAKIQNGVALIQGGQRMEAYARVAVTYSPETGSVVSLIPSVVENQGGTADAGVAAVVAQWQARAAQELSSVVGYAEEGVPDGSASLYNLITDSWLHAYPEADIAMTNAGGVRASLPAGDITRGDVITVLPFQNNLVELEMTGEEVAASVVWDIILAGMSAVNGVFLHADGTPLKMDSTYVVLTNDYLYAREDYPFSLYDPEPYPTGLNYAQPTIIYLEALKTSAADPLENYLDPVSRR